jgi:hypothetical protein
VTARRWSLRSGVRNGNVDPVSHASVSSWGSAVQNDTPRRLIERLLAFAHLAIDTVSRVKAHRPHHGLSSGLGDAGGYRLD